MRILRLFSLVRGSRCIEEMVVAGEGRDAEVRTRTLKCV